jgi:hypothetical protein
MRLHHLAIAASLAATCTLGHASTVFSDNFDGNTRALNATPAGWTVTGGTVDIIGTGFFQLAGPGTYIDMDGSTGNAGKMSISLNLTGGLLHTLTFDLAGNRRNGAAESVAVNFGSSASNYSLPQNAGFTGYSLNFTPMSTGVYTLSFEGMGGDNIGMLLDNVNVTAVPEPGTYALMALGLAAVAGFARRRQGAR